MAWSLAYFQKLPGGLDFSLMHQDSGIATTQGAGDADLSAMTRTDVRLGLPLRWGARRGELALVLQNLGAPYQDFAKSFQFERRAFVSLRIEN
jgi:iron complex outermembrane receptor protein